MNSIMFPAWSFADVLQFPCDDSKVLRLRSDIKYNEDSSHQILTNKSHVLEVPLSNSVGKIFSWTQ